MRSDLAERARRRLGVRRGPVGRRAAALATSAAVLLGVAACSPEEYVAPPPTTVESVVDADAASSTLADLQAAVVAGRSDAARELGASPDSSALLAALADNARTVGLADVTFTYVTETGRSEGEDGWQALVAVTWQVAGFDDASARLELPISFADAGRTITTVGDGSGRLPVWMSGPVGVSRSADVLVLGAAPAAELAVHRRQMDRAVAELRELLGGSPRLVVEVPADAAALDRALGVTPGTYEAIAAVTAPVDGSRTPQSPVHVFVNPGVHDAMDPVAAQVVATHEAVHAVTGAVLAQRAPLWLVEGFADYVALRDVDLPITRTAGQLIEQVADDGPPASLPADTAFATAAGHLGASYEAAWQVTVTLAERGGEDDLVALYRSMIDGGDLDAQLADRFGWSEAQLTDAWSERVAALGR